MSKLALLIHPPLGLFGMRLADYEVVHWPAGPQDSHYLFERFAKPMATKAKSAA